MYLLSDSGIPFLRILGSIFSYVGKGELAKLFSAALFVREKYHKQNEVFLFVLVEEESL